MTRDDIIRMAREAGIDAEKDTLCRYEGWVEPLERFFHAAYAAGAAAEREACASVVDANVAVCKNNSMLADVLAGNAAAIRARGIA